jgi:hypothetical protein
MNPEFDRRAVWTPPPRPEWLAKFNQIGQMMDIKSVISLSAESLMDEAKRNTGLSDFGADNRWEKHFHKLLEAIETEGKLTPFGRLLTRSDFLIYLEARLRITEEYKLHPEIEDEVIKEPVFIVGFGRSGTTILQEVLSHDPQFRSVTKWESLFPVPVPEKATYHTDPRIQKAQDLADVVHEASPEWATMHAWAGNLPVEDIEFTYPAFLSEVWATAFSVPSYEKYFAEQDCREHFEWHKRTLKLLQWKYKEKHWLLKNPTHLPRLPELLEIYPDAKFIIAHRDPIASGDSVANVLGIILYWRTDDPWGGGVLDEWLLADERAGLWDKVISWIETGIIKKGAYSNFIYAKFMEDPLAMTEKIYRDLGLDIDPVVFKAMNDHLQARHKSTHGNSQKYKKTEAEDPIAISERAKYKRYQEYFGVPNEAR